jgi:hypothetical protein
MNFLADAAPCWWSCRKCRPSKQNLKGGVNEYPAAQTLDFCFIAELPQNVLAGAHAILERE